MGARNVEPVNGGGDWVVTEARPLDLRGHRHEARATASPGLIGWEYHGDPPGHPGPGSRRRRHGLGRRRRRPQQWTATIYPGPKGNFVFNASTIFWAQGLSSPPGHTLPWSHWSRPHGPDERVQRITQNLLDRAIASPGK